ncbi:MAG: ABC transporter ATP-binding protein [Rhizobiales bacterium]|nr:ABC transporter ATP-binding protein [Hyphomicrobiales bacterium]
MKSIFRIFFRAASTKPLLVLSCMVLAGLFEMVSLGALVPLIGHLGGSGGNTQSTSQMSEFIDSLMRFIGLPNTFEAMIIFVVAAMIIKSVLSFGAHTYVAFAIAKVVSVMRANLVRQMLNARWSYFADQRSGRIANSISNDATRAGTAYQRSARFVAYIVQAIFYIIAALLISRELAVIGAVVGFILVVSLGWLIKVSRKAGYKQTDSTSDLVTYVSDAMNNIKPLKAMERQAPFVELFSRQIKSLRKSLVRQSLATFGRSYGHEGLVALFIGIAVYVATKQFNTPLSELVVAGIIFFQVTTVISRLQATLQDAAQLESAFWRLDELLQSTAAAAETNPGTLTPSLNSSAVFSKVSFAHGDTPVVNDIDLEFPAKKITVLQGGSGAGKTTIIDLLIGLHRPVEGTISLDGVSLNEIDLKAWRRMIGYVPQELTLFHGTIRENITLGDETISDDKVASAVKRAGASGFIERLPEGLDTVAGEMGAKLSGGQRQRIALARALVTEPSLLILDEVTSALDPETEREIVANIKELTGDYTIITVTHRPAWTAIADRLYTVKAGHVKLVAPTKPKRSSKSGPQEPAHAAG